MNWNKTFEKTYNVKKFREQEKIFCLQTKSITYMNDKSRMIDRNNDSKHFISKISTFP